MSKIDLEISDSIEFEDGDCAVIIKEDGTIGKVIMPKVNKELIQTDGYKRLLDVLELLKPGTRDKMIKYAEKGKGSIH